ncbi:MAG: pyridoxal phosphate-dependent aminotransferase [Planctomycetota bacterium]|jgi:aspartate/methionine/tyrosine aminotransferase
MPSILDFDAMISARARSIDVSGIRRVFELGAKLENPINLSIGQPDFPVPDEIKRATVEAVDADRNGYTLTQGAPELLGAISRRLADDVGWTVPSDDHGVLVTSGTSGALLLACLALLDPGDEIVVPDPFFVIYPALGSISGARVKYCDTYPDFRMTAERVEPLLTDRTKIVLIDSPGNPAGVVLTGDEQRELAELCEERGVMLISDEIYDAFTYDDALEDGRCPSPARYSENMLLVRGFGKTYGCTGWRLGFAAGPKAVTQQMAKLQQYTFVCAPSMAQVGVSVAFDVDMSGHVAAYRRKRDMVLDAFSSVVDVVKPGGAFYVFVPVPEDLGMTATEFAERAIERNVLVIPGGVFSQRDTHFRISYATPDDRLAAGLDVLRDLATSG